jgi:hypothetical protein
MLLLALAAIAFVGCGGSEDSESGETGAAVPPQARQQRSEGGDSHAAPDDTSEPAKAVAVFLNALRSGDDEKILAMYTERARQQVSQYSRDFAPKASDTARFHLGNVEYLAEDGARVACTWTDVDQHGQPYELKFLWMVRREPVGWRVAGMAAYPYPGEPPAVFDFENLEATLREAELLEEEVRRREQGVNLQAQRPSVSRESAPR